MKASPSKIGNTLLNLSMNLHATIANQKIVREAEGMAQLHFDQVISEWTQYLFQNLLLVLTWNISRP